MLPNLLIIGAMKCGTTSLHNYLNLHPEIYMTQEKELDYFIEKKNYKKGLNWYKSKFNSKNSKILGESSPNYTKYPLFKDVPKNIFNLIPDIKMIYIVRDPITRLISHYKHNYTLGREKTSFEQCFNRLEKNNYIYSSMYYLQLSKYLKYFKKDNIYILDSENLLNNPVSTLKSIFDYLDVDRNFVSQKFHKKYHVSSVNIIHNKLGILITDKGFHIKIKKILPKFIYYLIFQKNAEIPEINNNTIESIKNCLSEDTIKFKRATGLSFPDWYIENNY